MTPSEHIAKLREALEDARIVVKKWSEPHPASGGATAGFSLETLDKIDQALALTSSSEPPPEAIIESCRFPHHVKRDEYVKGHDKALADVKSALKRHTPQPGEITDEMWTAAFEAYWRKTNEKASNKDCWIAALQAALGVKP